MTNENGAARTPQSEIKVDWSQLRLLTAVLLTVVGGFIGIFLMISGENHMLLPDNFITLDLGAQQKFLDTMIGKGLQPYCTGFGLLLLLVGIAYLLLGYNDRTHTDVKSPTPEDEDTF